MSKVLVTVTIVMIVCFHCVSVNISFNFICFIIESNLYYLDCTYKLLKTKPINPGCLELLFLLPSPWLLVYSVFFFVSFVRLLMGFLLLLAPDCFVYCLDRPYLLLIEKLMNLGCLGLLLLAPLLPIAPGRSLCPVLMSSVCVFFACA